MADPLTYEAWLLLQQYAYAQSEVVEFERNYFNLLTQTDTHEEVLSTLENSTVKRQENLTKIKSRMQAAGVTPDVNVPAKKLF